MALGNNSTAFGNYSVAIGQSSYAVLQSYAFGQNATNRQQSLAIGRFVETTFSGINSIILGSSVSGQVGAKMAFPTHLRLDSTALYLLCLLAPRHPIPALAKLALALQPQW